MDASLRGLYDEFLARPSAHVPDITSMEQLLDMVSVGNIIQLSRIMDVRGYTPDGIPLPEIREQTFALGFYTDFVEGFRKEYDVLLPGGEAMPDVVGFVFKVSRQPIFPMELITCHLQESILRLCVTLVYYGYRAAPPSNLKIPIPHIGPALLRRRLKMFIKKRHPSVLELFKDLADRAQRDAALKDKDNSLSFTRKYSLDWTGPAFTIQLKTSK